VGKLDAGRLPQLVRKESAEPNNYSNSGSPAVVSSTQTKLIPCPECGHLLGEEILPLHLKSCHSPENDILALPIPNSRLTFTLLPPGTGQISEVVAYFRKNEKQITQKAGGRAIDWGRLTKIQSLKPIRCYVGTNSFLGYVVFEFKKPGRVVLECPIENNAIYILSGDWREMVSATKSELRQRFPNSYKKIVHTGNWLGRIREALRK